MRRMDGYLIGVGERIPRWKRGINILQKTPVVATRKGAPTVTVLPPMFTTTHVYRFIPQ
jgi:hypothetical protein